MYTIPCRNISSLSYSNQIVMVQSTWRNFEISFKLLRIKTELKTIWFEYDKEKNISTWTRIHFTEEKSLWYV